MAPRRSGRRNISDYKKGDYIEYQYKGSTVTGKLLKKSAGGSNPVWIVNPSDRRRKNEEIPEKVLGKVINAQEAMNNRGPKLKKGNRISRENSHASSRSNSDGSVDEPQAPKRKNGRDSSSDDNSKASESDRKRKSDDSNGNSGSERANKNHKTVTFSQDSNATSTSNNNRRKKPKKAKAASTRIGTRSTRGSGEAILLPDLPIKRKKTFAKGKKLKKDENVTVVRMLTGTLYLFRGDRPRAEFVRFK